MLEQLEETRSKGDGPRVMEDRGVATVEHGHDHADSVHFSMQSDCG